MAPSQRTVRARAPLRLGLAGGGTDLPFYCDRFGGAVLNTTINRFAYAFVNPRTDGLVAFEATDRNAKGCFDPAQTSPEALRLHRGVYERIVHEFNGGAPLSVTLRTTVDAPPDSGLGSSSALVVAMIAALLSYLGIPWVSYEVAQLAVDIERRDLCQPGGQQDHYAAAIGGINFIEFRGGNEVVVNSLRLPDDIRNELEASLVICFVGGVRNATAIIEQQNINLARQNPNAIEAFHQLKAGAFAIKDSILLGDIPRMASLLGASWSAKKRTADGVSTRHIERLFDVATARGALAGKISGAGGGGFLMFVIPPEDRFELINALDEAGGIPDSVKFTEGGCEAWGVRPWFPVPSTSHTSRGF